MKLFPLYVPTKNRADTSKLLPLLTASKIQATMVLERKQLEPYQRLHNRHKVLEIPGDDLGLPFARQLVLDEAEKRGEEWIWMLDDDISGFFRSLGGKNVRSPPEDVLLAAQATIGPNIGQVALEYQQYSWSAKAPWKRNSYCDVAVLIRTGLGQKFDNDVTLKLDRDFTIQTIALGYDTIRCCQLAFAAPKNGSNKGGLFDEYAASGVEREASRRLALKWPWCVKTNTKQDGREDAKILWEKIRRGMPPR